MKKGIALCLAVLLLCGALASALAEPGYVYIRDRLMQEYGQSLFAYAEGDDVDNLVLLVYDLDPMSITLIGTNEDGEPDGCVWYVDDTGVLLTDFLVSCALWDSIADELSEGYELLICVYSGDQSIFVESAEEATRMVSDFIEWANENSANYGASAGN